MIKRSSSDRWLAPVLILCLALQPLLADGAREETRSPLPETVWLQHDDVTYRIDYAGLLAGADAFAREETAEITVVLSRVGSYENVGGAASDGASPLETVTVVPARDDDARPITTLLRRTWSRTPLHLRAALTSGSDELIVEMPRAWLVDARTEDAAEPARITLNGATVELKRATVDRIIAELTTRGEIGDALLQGELMGLATLPMPLEPFTRHVELLRRAEGAVRTTFFAPGLAHAVDGSCAPECAGCAFALMSSLMGAAALAIPCGGSVFTGGLALPACLAAIVGLILAQGMTFVRCEACVSCLQPPPPGDGGGDGGGGGGAGSPDGSCPAQYHECCENMCCSDLQPPPTCEG